MSTTPAPPKPIRFTPREEQIARLFLAGKDTDQICEAIGLAYGTVGCYLHNIKKKIGVTNNSKVALALALQAIMKPQ